MLKINFRFCDAVSGMAHYGGEDPSPWGAAPEDPTAFPSYVDLDGRADSDLKNLNAADEQ